MPRERLLLDTHIWIWLMMADSSLSIEEQERIAKAARYGGILISAISVWEVAMLEKKGRLALNAPCKQWVDRALSAPGINLIPLSPEIAVESCHLPDLNLKDPADRMIVATARVENATLLTHYGQLLAYGQNGHVKVHIF